MANIPAIRFKGFNDPWEQRKLGELSDIKTGDSDLQDADSNGIYPFFVRSEIIERSNRYLFDGEAILVPGEGKLGEIFHYINGKFDYHQRVYKISNFLNISGKFVYHAMQASFKKHALKNTVKATVDSIRLPTLTEYEFMAPVSLREQREIVSSLDTLDNLITLHQRKYEKLSVLKKSLLEKMFPREGENKPEVRFAGFTDPWEQRKVSGIADRFDSLRVPVSANLRIPGTTPYYGANGIQDYVEGFTHEGEFVLVAEDGANDLKNYPVKCVNGRIWVNNHAHVLQSKPEIADNKFLAYSIGRANIEVLLVGGSRAKLNATAMMNIDLFCPGVREQVAIGSFFSQLDNLITLHQRKSALRNRLKRGWLKIALPDQHLYFQALE